MVTSDVRRPSPLHHTQNLRFCSPSKSFIYSFIHSFIYFIYLFVCSFIRRVGSFPRRFSLQHDCNGVDDDDDDDAAIDEDGCQG
jgi:hypothetical protein